MNLLEMCTSQSWGGMEMRTLKISESFKELGHSVTLLCYPESALYKEAQKIEIKTITLPFKNGIHFSLILQLRKILKQNQFDLIHTQFSRDLRFIVPAAEKLNKQPPIVLTKRLGSFVDKKDFFHKYLYSRVDLITAISEVIKKNVIDTCPVEPNKVEVFYNGIDISKYREALKHRERIRKEFGIKDEVVIGLIGRFSPGKGHEDFLHAAKIIIEKRKHTKFLIVGSESFGEEKYAESIYKLAEDLRLKDHLVFTGYRKDIPELMGAIDILAVPSHAEAFGNVAIEGMAAGKPVVASNKDGLLEIVVNEKTGLFFETKNVSSLANALIKLIDDKNLRDKFGSEGLKRVQEKFDEQTQIKKLEQKFIDLIELKKDDKN